MASAPADPLLQSASARGRVVLVQSVDTPSWPADPLTIGTITIEGDTLRANVSYGGGCRTHTLQLISETSWMESFPVQVHARISHFARGDLCRAIISQVLHVDLSPLREEYRRSYGSGPGRIQLRIRGALYVPVYVFE